MSEPLYNDTLNPLAGGSGAGGSLPAPSPILPRPGGVKTKPTSAMKTRTGKIVSVSADSILAGGNPAQLFSPRKQCSHLACGSTCIMGKEAAQSCPTADFPPPPPPVAATETEGDAEAAGAMPPPPTPGQLRAAAMAAETPRSSRKPKRANDGRLSVERERVQNEQLLYRMNVSRRHCREAWWWR